MSREMEGGERVFVFENEKLLDEDKENTRTDDRNGTTRDEEPASLVEDVQEEESVEEVCSNFYI